MYMHMIYMYKYERDKYVHSHRSEHVQQSGKHVV